MSQGLPSHVGVVGLGYVGLSVAAAFGRVLPTLGFDVDARRVEELQQGSDRNGEVSEEDLKASCLVFTHLPEELIKPDVFIVAVPTAIDTAKRPDLSHLKEASRLVGKALKARHEQRNGPGELAKPIVVYESTSYPGCTEDICIPVLERESELKVGEDFTVGYSPERINPGDPEHTLSSVIKVVAARDTETIEVMARLYGMVVQAGVYKVPDIRTAEAAKVIENVQRDLNIALMNELSMLFHHMNIDTGEVLKAARTKWNFLPFEPGLVGGHCIPVDPYYLTHRAEEVGFHPEVILAGRRINDSMSTYVAQQTVALLTKAGIPVKGAKTLMLGVTFKEDVRDVRNSQVLELVRELEDYGIQVNVNDPLLRLEELEQMGLKALGDPFEADARYDAVILALPHRAFRNKKPEDYRALLKDEGRLGALVDIRGALNWNAKAYPGVLYWRL